MEQNVDGRVAVLETRVENVEKKVENISSINEAIVRLATIQERQEERSKKLDEAYINQMQINAEVNVTLKNINENLENMNSEIRSAKKQIGDLETKVDIVNEKSKIDLLTVIKSYVPGLIVSGALFFVLKFLGYIQF